MGQVAADTQIPAEAWRKRPDHAQRAMAAALAVHLSNASAACGCPACVQHKDLLVTKDAIRPGSPCRNLHSAAEWPLHDEQSVGRTNRTVLDLLRALNGRQLVLLGSSTEAHVAQATMCALASHGREDAIGQFKRWGWANLLISTRFWPPTRKRAISPKHEGCATYGAFDATHRDLVSHRRRYVFSALSPCYDVDRFEREVLDGGADVVVVAYHPVRDGVWIRTRVGRLGRLVLVEGVG